MSVTLQGGLRHPRQDLPTVSPFILSVQPARPCLIHPRPGHPPHVGGGEKCCTHRSSLPACGFRRPHSTAPILWDLPWSYPLSLSPAALVQAGCAPWCHPNPQHRGQGKDPCLFSELLSLTREMGLHGKRCRRLTKHSRCAFTHSPIHSFRYLLRGNRSQTRRAPMGGADISNRSPICLC